MPQTDYSFKVEDGTEEVKAYAFAMKSSVREVTLPGSVKTIKKGAFFGCAALETVCFSEGLETIEDDAFRGCVSLKRLDLPVSLRHIGNHAVTDCGGPEPGQYGLDLITVAEGNPVFFTDGDALYERVNAVQKIKLVRYFGKKREYRIPDFVTSIGVSAFRMADIRHLIVPPGVTETGEEAFHEVTSLKTITLEADNVDVYIPQSPSHWIEKAASLMTNVTQGVRADRDRMFDYAGYDTLTRTFNENIVFSRMACFRLKNPVELAEEHEQHYREWLARFMDEIMDDICRYEDLKYLTDLLELGIIDRGNSDLCLRKLLDHGKTSLAAFFMEYRNADPGNDAFDFSL